MLFNQKQKRLDIVKMVDLLLCGWLYIIPARRLFDY